MSQLEKISTLLLLQFGVKILEFLQRYGPGDLASDSISKQLQKTQTQINIW